MRQFLLAAVFAAALAAPAADAAAWVRFGPPPPVRERMVVRPGPRHVWLPGYYRWNGARYYWVNGYWAVPPRPHAVWVPGYWAHRPHGYIWVAGFWR